MKMKKLFATLAASAVAVSMFAFTGCGPKSDVPEGGIDGKYEEKTDEEIKDIVDNIDLDKVLGGDTPAEGLATMNLGIAIDLNQSIQYNEISSSNSIKLDYKESFVDGKPIGVGTATFKTESQIPSYSEDLSVTTQKINVELSGSLYNSNEWIYGAASGSLSGSPEFEAINEQLKDGMCAKINLAELAEALEDMGGDIGGIGGFKPASFYEAESAFDLATLLAMAKQYGVKVAVDDSDGVKLRLTVDQETVWTAFREVSKSEGATDEQIEAVITEAKEGITFNKFQFEVFFAIDKDGKFAGASVVADIDVKVDSSLISGDDELTKAAATDDSAMTFSLKGSAKIYTHNETVTVPAGVTTDLKYIDMTKLVINAIGNIGK